MKKKTASKDELVVLNYESEVPKPVVQAELPAVDVTVDVPKPKAPSWYKFRLKAEYKKDRIKEIMKEYDAFFKIEKEAADPRDRDQYLKELTKLNIKQLFQIGVFNELKPSYTIIDKWNKIDSKNSMVIRIYHKNKSSTDYMIAKHTRVISINAFSYMFPPNAGVYDNKHKKTCYAYYEGNTFPIEFSDDAVTTDRHGNTYPDAELLKRTLSFEYAQKLAASEMGKKVDITYILVIINLFLTAAIVIMCVKGFELI